MSHSAGFDVDKVRERIEKAQELIDQTKPLSNEPNDEVEELLVHAVANLNEALELLAGPAQPHEKLSKVAIIEYYKDKKKEHRWRAIGRNGVQVADSGEGYKNQSDMLQMAGELWPGVEMREVKE